MKKARLGRLRLNFRHYNDSEGVTPKSVENSENEIIRGGFLYKEGAMGMKGSKWKSRYFLLTDERMYYFQDDKSSAPCKGVIPLQFAAVDRARDKELERPYAFKVCTERRVFYLAATDMSEMTSWIDTVQRCIDRLAELNSTTTMEEEEEEPLSARSEGGGGGGGRRRRRGRGKGRKDYDIDNNINNNNSKNDRNFDFHLDLDNSNNNDDNNNNNSESRRRSIFDFMAKHYNNLSNSNNNNNNNSNNNRMDRKNLSIHDSGASSVPASPRGIPDVHGDEDNSLSALNKNSINNHLNNNNNNNNNNSKNNNSNHLPYVTDLSSLSTMNHNNTNNNNINNNNNNLDNNLNNNLNNNNNNIINTTSIAIPPFSPRQPDLTEQQEMAIAVSAWSIFSRPSSERSAAEEAYVTAMRDYAAGMRRHMAMHEGTMELGLASATVLFLDDNDNDDLNNNNIEDISELISTIRNTYISALQDRIDFSSFSSSSNQDNKNNKNNKLNHSNHSLSPLIQDQISIDEESQIAEAAAAIYAKQPHDRTDEEKEYVQHMDAWAAELCGVEHVHGVEPEHGLASGTTIFGKLHRESTVSDQEYMVVMNQRAKEAKKYGNL